MADGKVNIQERLKQIEVANKSTVVVTADDIRKDGIPLTGTSLTGIPYEKEMMKEMIKEGNIAGATELIQIQYRKLIHDKLRAVTKMDENAPIYIGTHPVDLLPTVHPDLLCYDLFCEIINYDKDICDIITLDTNEGKEFRKQITDMGLIQLAIYKVLKG